MKRNNQEGSHLVGVMLAVVAVGVIALAGVRVWQMQQATAQTLASTSNAPTATVPTKITNAASLTQAATALDASSTQVNASLDDSTLNSDLNDML